MEAIVYSTPACTWCDKVTNLLIDAEAEVNKIDITESRENFDMMTNVAGNVRTVPQVVVDGKYIGGYKETEEYLRRKN